MSNEVTINAEVAYISKKLENALLTMRPAPTVEALAVTFAHWAARAALAVHASEAEFFEGIKEAWKLAQADFAAAVPGFYAQKDRQS